MGSLANCLKIHNIPDEHARIINEWADQYRADGHPGPVAIERSIQDLINRTKKDLDEIKAQIPEHLKGSTLSRVERELQMASLEELDAMVERGGKEPAEKKPEPAAPRTTTTRTGGVLITPAGGRTTPAAAPAGAGKLLSDAAKEVGAGAEEALKGLFELFGGGKATTMGGVAGLDKEAYESAKPHFEKAWDHWKKAGKSLQEFVNFLLDHFGDKIKLPLRGYLHELKTGESPIIAEEKKPEPTPTPEPPAVTGIGAEEGAEEPTGPAAPTDEELAVPEEGATTGPAETPKEPRKRRPKGEAKPEPANTFENKGEVWDPYKRTLDKEAKDPTEQNIRRVLAMATRSIAFQYAPVAEPTYGVARYIASIRDSVQTFQQYYATKLGHWRSYGFDDRIIRTIMEKPAGEMRDAAMEEMKVEAAKYMAFAKSLTDSMNEKSVGAARAGVATLMWTPDFFNLKDDNARRSKRYDEVFRTKFHQENAALIGTSYTQRDRFFTSVFSKEFENTENLERITPKRYKRPANEETVRTGLPDHRKGKDIKDTNEFDAPFQFKAIGFGEWVDQTERQRVVNAAFDAFHDIAQLLGIETKMISFFSEMQMQFGNLGTMDSRASALYVPSEVAINLSKTKGDGSLSHEWGHGLEAALLKHGDYVHEGGARAAFKDIFRRLNFVFDPAAGEKFLRETLANVEYFKRYKRMSGESIKDMLRRLLRDGFDDAVIHESQFKKNALNSPQKAAYYSNEQEMWARAFEAWAYDTLAEMKAENNYLVNNWVADGYVSPENGYAATIYPTGEERLQFKGYMTDFFKALTWTKMEDGTPLIKIDPAYEMIQERERKEVVKLRDEALLRIEEILNELFPSVQSPDGLYWYAYKAMSRGKAMQPDGFFAYDDTFTHPDASSGKGAVGYPKPLSVDMMMDFGLIPYVHTATETTIYLKEGGTDAGVQGPGGITVEEGETEDVGGPGGPRAPGAGPGERDITGGEDVPVEVEGGGKGGSGTGVGPGVRTPPVGGGPEGTTTGPHAVPAADNYFIADPVGAGRARTLAERFTGNISAIRTLKEVEAAGRLPTQEEKETLALYSGWGGLGEALPGVNYARPSWRDRAEVADSTMTADEKTSARRQADVAYYTPADIYAAVYKALSHMGFKGGKILGPALGIGNEFGTVPVEMRHEGTSYHGIEPDQMAYRIGKLLYGKAFIENTTLESAILPPNFDLVISNVPFSREQPADKRFNKEKFPLHDYFFRRALHHTRPGGMVAFITTTGTMDKQNSLLRDTISKEGGQLVAAFRMPPTFDNTEVIADLIFVRKNLQGSTFVGKAWSKLKQIAVKAGMRSDGSPNMQDMPINEYYAENPDHILGDLALGQSRFDDTVLKVTKRDERRVSELIEEKISTLPEGILAESKKEEEIDVEDLLPAPGEIRDSTYFIKDDEVFWKEGGLAHPVEKFSPKGLEILKAMVELKTAYQDVLRADIQEAPDAEVKRAILNKLYDEFFKKNGTVTSQIEYMIKDIQHYHVLALENVDIDTEVVTKADIFTKPTVKKYQVPTHANSADEALTFSLAWRGKVDMEYMEKITGMKRDDILERLAGKIFDSPAHGLIAADDYLSGNVKEKLRDAEAAARADKKYQVNVDALKAVQPRDVPLKDIYVPIGSPVVDPKIMARFINDALSLSDYSLSISLGYSEKTNSWTVKWIGTGYNNSKAQITRSVKRAKRSNLAIRTYGIDHPDGNAINLLTSMLNGSPVQIKMNVDEDGKMHFPGTKGPGKNISIVDKTRTQAAQLKAEALQAAFEKYLEKNPEDGQEVERAYNEKWNTDVLYKADGRHLKDALPGKNPSITLGEHQLSAIWRWITKGNTYLAHEVGVGKTYEMAAIIMEARRLKLRKKPILLAHGPTTVEQLQREFLHLYPLAKLLVVDIQEKAEARQAQVAKIQSGDYDAVIMTKQSFGRIPLSPARRAAFLEAEVADLEMYLLSLRKGVDDKTIAEIDKKIKAMKAQIERLLQGEKGEAFDAIYFDDLGIDLLVADEAHAFKNLPFTTRLAGRGSKVKGVTPTPSTRATDFYMKTKFINDQHRGGLVMASGTPLTNSVAELYNISRMLQPEELERRGIKHFDAWVKLYGVIKPGFEPSPTGTGFKTVQKFAEFANLPELIKMTRLVMDVVTGVEAGVKRPKIRGGAPVNVVVEQSPLVTAYQEVLNARMAAVEANPMGATYKGKPDIMLTIIGDGKKAAIDFRLIDDTTPEQADSKIVVAAKNIIEEYKKTDADKGVQLVFADLGVPGYAIKQEAPLTEEELNELEPEERQAYELRQLAKSTTGWNVYDGLRQKLIDGGIKPEEIEYIQTGMKYTGQKRKKWIKDTYAKVRNGKIRVFFGSSETMGTGVNVQDRVTAMHHMDVWWNFSSYVQRNGRGWRRGNELADKYGGVAIMNYATKQTVDSFVWGKNASKGQVIGSVMEGNLSRRRVEDISDDTMTAFQMMAHTSGRPEFLELATLKEKWQKLRIKEDSFLEEQRAAREESALLPGKIQSLEAVIARAQEDALVLDPVDSVMFDGDPQIYTFEKHGKAIAEKLQQIFEKAPEIDQLLEAGGLKAFHFATLGTSVESGVDEKTKKKTYSFKEAPLRAFFRAYSAGVGISSKIDQRRMAGIALGVSGKISTPLDAKFTDTGSTGRLENFDKAVRPGLVDGTLGKVFKVGDIQMAYMYNGIVGNLSRTLTKGKNDLKVTVESSQKEMEQLRASADKSKAIIDQKFPQQEELDKAQARIKELEVIVMGSLPGQAAAGGAAAVNQVLAGKRVVFSNGWDIRAVKVDGNTRLEILGPGFRDRETLKEAGIKLETDSQSRWHRFVPRDRMDDIIAAIEESFNIKAAPEPVAIHDEGFGRWSINDPRKDDPGFFAGWGQAVEAAAPEEEETEEGEGEEEDRFAAANGWDSITGGTDQYRRNVTYKEGPDSKLVADLKRSLLADKRFKDNPEMQVRIQAIQEVVAPKDADTILSEQIRKIMGPDAKLVFVDSSGLFREVQHEVLGVGNVVYVDIRAPQILSSLVAHGLWHADKSRYKQALIDVLKGTVDPKKFRALAAEFRSVPHYANMTDNQLWEEFGARFIEGQIAQPDFWSALAKKSRTIYLRLAKWVIDTLNKLGIEVGGTPPVWGEYFSHPEKMATAVRAAQDYFLNKMWDLTPGPKTASAASFAGEERREDLVRRALIDNIMSFKVRSITELRGMTDEKLQEISDFLDDREKKGTLVRGEGPLSQSRFSAGTAYSFVNSRLFDKEDGHPVTEAAENPMVPPEVAETDTPEEAAKKIKSNPIWGKIFLNVPNKDLSTFTRTASLPWWIAKKDKQGRNVMNVQLNREDERNELLVALTRSTAGAHLSDAAAAELDNLISSMGGDVTKVSPDDVVSFARNENTALHGYFGWKTSKPETRRKLAAAMLRRGKLNEFLSLDFKEAEALGKVIVESDSYVERDEKGEITRAGKVFSAEELKAKGFNEKQITAYFSWKNGMDAAWETKLTYARASIFWPYAGKPWMIETARTSGPLPLRGLKISDLEKVADGTLPIAKAREHIRVRAERLKYDPEVAFKEFSNALAQVKAPLEKIKKYREQWGKIKFYMPRFREQGPIVLRVPGAEGEKDLFYKRYENIPGTDLSRQAKIDYDKLVAEHGYDNVEFYRSPVIPENIYGDISEAALQKFTERAIGRLQEEGTIDAKEAADLTESLFQELANDLNVRGFGQRSMPRAPGVPTKGYKEEKFQEIYRDYMSGLAGFVTKRKAAMEFHRALADMRPKRDKEGKPTGGQRWQSFDYWRRYAEDMLRNQDRGDEISAKVRSLAFLYFISGNLKGALVNLTQSFVSTIPVGSKLTKGAEAKVLGAMRDVAFGRLTPTEKRALQEAHDKGETTAQYIEDIMDQSMSGRDQTLNKIGAVLSIPFRKAEIFNRKAAFLFAYRVYAAQGKTHGEAREGARDFVNDTQYMFGKANLPEWARSGTGAGKILRTSYTFRSYSHNYINSMAHYLLKDAANGKDSTEFRVLARSLAYLAILGGAGAGVPFLDELLDILERETGIQWRRQARDYIEKAFGPIARDFWLAGLPAMFGVDISGSLKIGLPSVSSPEETLYGVYGGMIDKGQQAMQMAASGQFGRAGETLLPSFAANPIRAVREATAGAKTARGATKFDEKGRPLVLSGGEAAARAVGFRPVRDTISSQERREYDNLVEFHRNKRENIYAAFRSASPSERAQIRKEAQAYNRSVLKFRGAVPRIDIGELNKKARPEPSTGYMRYQRLGERRGIQ